MLVEVTADRKVPRVIAFLNLICATYRKGRIVIVTDNINTRKGPDAKCRSCSRRSTAAGSIK